MKNKVILCGISRLTYKLGKKRGINVIEIRIKKMFLVFLITIIFTNIINSCKTNSTSLPILPQIPPVLAPIGYGRIVLQQVDYDVVQITHEAGQDLSSQHIYQIEIGRKQDTIFNQIAAFPSNYDTLAQTYIIHFKFTVALDSTSIRFPLTIRYMSNDNTNADVDTMVLLYKYPYISSEIFFDHSYPYQDIARNQTTLFLHGWNEGLTEYDLTTQQINQYDFYRIGTHITACEDYVFCDVDHQKLVRFNIASKTTDMTFSSLQDVQVIEGIATQDSSVYVIARDLSSTYLKRFSFDGVMQDSMLYPGDPYFMAMADSIVYCKYYLGNGPQMSRFSLKTKSFLPNVLSPASRLAGIEIFRDTLYYCDVYKKFVGTVPVADLIPVN